MYKYTSTCGMISDISVQVVTHLDLRHDDDDAMMHVMIMHSMMYIHSYTL